MANEIFEKRYALRSSDFDCFLQIKPSAVLDLFQDIAGIHAQNLGIGFHDLIKRKLLWVVMKVKYQVVKSPHMYQNVTVRTWPKEPHRLDFKREYLILDENNQVLIKGTSQWAVINSETRKIARVQDMYVNIDGFLDKNNFDEKLVRVTDFQKEETAIGVKSMFSELDCNGHINNIRYADYVVNAIMPKTPLNISLFQIDFHKEIMCGDTTDIFIKEEKDGILAKGMQGEEIMFSCKIEREGMCSSTADA